MTEALLQHWQQLLATAGIPDSATTEKLREELWAAYGSAGRHYHNLEHLTELMALHEEYADHLTDLVVVGFAIFYHDLVYSTLRPGANERRSAEIARQRLALLALPAPQIEAVHQLILDTQEHTVLHARQVPDAALLLDLDLAILGAPRERYAQYMQQIRREYGHVPTRFYRSGRLRALRALYQRPRIYATDLGYTRWETPARRNLEVEMAFLERRD